MPAQVLEIQKKGLPIVAQLILNTRSEFLMLFLNFGCVINLMLNQQKRKEIFLPRLENLFPERPPLLCFKQHPISQPYNNIRVIKPGNWSPMQHEKNGQKLLSRQSLYQRISEKEKLKYRDRFEAKSARESLNMSINKENNDDIFIKRGQLNIVHRKSLHSRLSEQTQKVAVEAARQIKFKAIKLEKIKLDQKLMVFEELSGWNNKEEDSYSKIIEQF